MFRNGFIEPAPVRYAAMINKGRQVRPQSTWVAIARHLTIIVFDEPTASRENGLQPAIIREKPTPKAGYSNIS